MILEVLAKVVLGAEEIRICKIEERKIFREIILSPFVSEIVDTTLKHTNLYWSAGENYPTFDVKFVQSLESLRVWRGVRVWSFLAALYTNQSSSICDLRHKATVQCYSRQDIL
jgi:hypothetical protein